jgi:hypothetical protein
MTTKTIEKDFTTTILVNESAKSVFDAVNNVSGWWSQEIEGDTDRLNSEFKYHYSDVHICKMRIVEFIPEKKVVWQVLENHFNFIKDQREWVGTKVIFEISQKDNKTELHFTHQGLVPDYECFDICFKAWTQYIQESLVSLITTGKGQPNAKED